MRPRDQCPWLRHAKNTPHALELPAEEVAIELEASKHVERERPVKPIER